MNTGGWNWRARPLGLVNPVDTRVTSMCMEIAGFDHDDCPGEWCTCGCHTERQAVQP